MAAGLIRLVSAGAILDVIILSLAIGTVSPQRTADPVSALQVLRRVLTTMRQRHDVIDAGSLFVWPFQRRVDGLVTDAADPTIPLEDCSPVDVVDHRSALASGIGRLSVHPLTGVRLTRRQPLALRPAGKRTVQPVGHVGAGPALRQELGPAGQTLPRLDGPAPALLATGLGAEPGISPLALDDVVEVSAADQAR